MNTRYQRWFASASSSSLDIVSACQRMNQLTFMLSNHCRNPGLTCWPNIKIPEHWQNSKIFSWRDSQLCQGQAAVEPEYCRAQVAHQMMMMNTSVRKDKIILLLSCQIFPTCRGWPVRKDIIVNARKTMKKRHKSYKMAIQQKRNPLTILKND